MARLIVKSPYIKGKPGGSGAGGYLEYIGTRDGVELLPSGYMEYMAKRPRSHGLFGDEDSVDLQKAVAELNSYPGNVWTHIISLKREDAVRLGYDHAEAWRDLLRTHRNKVAAAMHIPPGDFRWYAAFHDEGDHPHVHMMAWSTKPGQAYLSKEGIAKIKSGLTNDIFKQEMLHTYEKKSVSRDELVAQAKAQMKTLAQALRKGVCDAPQVEMLMMTLADQLETANGKRVYGYLKKDTKATVDQIVDEMEKLPVVDRTYEAWWQLQCQVMDYYAEQPDRERPRLSQQKEFTQIKNIVIREAENIRLGVVTFEDEGLDTEDEVDAVLQAPDQTSQWWMITQNDAAPMAYREEAARMLLAEAENGDAYAQYDVGRLYRDGPVFIPDWAEAVHWLEQAATRLPAAQYALRQLLLTDDPEVRDPETGIRCLELAAQRKSGWAAYRLGKEYASGKSIPKDMEKAAAWFTQAAEAGNGYAQYVLGKLYLTGDGVKQDRETARHWFRQSAAQGSSHAQFFLDRWDTLRSPSLMLSATRLLYHMSSVFEDVRPAYAGAKAPRIDRKRLAQIREKKIALGHKPDDHEEQGWNMTM